MMTPKMKAKRWRQIEALFHAARERQPGERAEFLAKACAGDEELRREVDSLLTEHEREGSVLGHAPSELAAEWAQEQKYPATGQTLGHFRIVSELGKGGMGEVYLAEDQKLRRKVALKLLPREFATQKDSLRRFEQEARAASALNHPNIVTIYEIDQAGDTHFIATEFVDGATLKVWSQTERRTWRETVALLVGVADGLAAAHSARILHRDIKPDNILVAKSGIAKLADFGLAKLLEGIDSGAMTQGPTEGRTRPGIIMGTIAYMSPEQASGRPTDARSDIFSFGVVLYEMLAGRRPFEGATELELLQTIIHRPQLPLSEELPFELRLVIDKSLEKDPGDRYQTMRDLVVDLRRVLRHKVAEMAPSAVAKLPRRWLPWIAVVGLAAGIGVWETMRPVAAPNPLANAQFTRLTDFEGAEMEAAISPDGRFVAFLSDRDGPFQVWMSQVGSGHFVKLHDEDERKPVRSLGFSADGSEIWLAGRANLKRLRLMPLIGGAPRTFLDASVVNVAWSPDGARVVYDSNAPGDPMFVADRTGANARQIFASREGVHNHYPTWSPDGQWIYFVSGLWDTYEMDLWRIRPSGGEPERLTRHNNDVVHPAPLDRQTVLYVAPAEDGSGPWLWAVDVDRKATRRLSFGVEKYTSVAASADGQRIVATVANPSVNLWSVPILDRLAEERDVKSVPLPNVRALGPRFGGTSLFYLSSRGAGDGLWRYQNGQASEIWKGSDGALLEPAAASPDGRRVAIVLRQQGKRRLHVISADGGELRPLAEMIDVRGAACWSPDGKWIVTDGYDAQGEALFKIPVDGGAPLRLAAGRAFNPVWSPDGNLIVYAGANVGAVAPLLAVRPDGAPVELPAIRIPGGGERYRFLPNGNGLVFMQGFRDRSTVRQDFWLLDLATKKARQLTQLDSAAAMRTFDITPDGQQIVFDRLRENSDIVLIELAK
jgi:serine/threonine protein kinase/Tol biopolymer transport system component